LGPGWWLGWEQSEISRDGSAAERLRAATRERQHTNANAPSSTITEVTVRQIAYDNSSQQRQNQHHQQKSSIPSTMKSCQPSLVLPPNASSVAPQSALHNRSNTPLWRPSCATRYRHWISKTYLRRITAVIILAYLLLHVSTIHLITSTRQDCDATNSLQQFRIIQVVGQSVILIPFSFTLIGVVWKLHKQSARMDG
jgi:cobalamin biosynthesis Mg chelatase CobN